MAEPIHDCELCRALLALAESAVANRAAAAERRDTMRVVKSDRSDAA